MKGRLGYLFYEKASEYRYSGEEGEFSSDPEFFFTYPSWKEYQGKIIKIVYFEVED